MHLKLLFLALVVLATAHGLAVRKKAEGGQAAAAKSVKREESEAVEVEKTGDSKDSDETEESKESKSKEEDASNDLKDSGESKDDDDSKDSKDSGESKDDDDSNDSKDSGESKDDDDSNDSKDSGESKDDDDSNDSKDSDDSKDDDDSSDSKGSSEGKDGGDEPVSTEGEVNSLTAETFRRDITQIIEDVAKTAEPLEHTENLAIKYVIEPSKENAVAVGEALQDALGQAAMSVSKSLESILWLFYRLITTSDSEGFAEDEICSAFSNLELKGGEFADAAQGITLTEELSKAFIHDVACFAEHIRNIEELRAEIDSDHLTKSQALRINVEAMSYLQRLVESGNRFSLKLATAFTPLEATTPANTESGDENAKRALARLLRTLQNNPDLLTRRSPK